jgi:chromosome segregation ATPase
MKMSDYNLVEEKHMEKSSSNQSLSTLKKNYYTLAKEVNGIESRVVRLEEEDERQRRRLENMKMKNHHLQDVK